MTERHHKVISEYRAADFNRRLHMYLQFPWLRSEFILIDQRDLNAESHAGFTTPFFSLSAGMSVLLGSAASCIKKLLGVASA